MAGMNLDVNFVLQAVSYVLIEKQLISTFPAPVVPGSQIVVLVDPALYVGAQIIAGNPGSLTQEIVTVTAITDVNFTATFANAHATGEVLRGATFASGHVNQLSSPNVASTANVAPLFTQGELLGYFRDVQNDFLERTRAIYAVATAPLTTNNPVGAVPADCIRLERVDIDGVMLWAVSQEELDLSDQDAQGQSDVPTNWYWDRLGNGQFAVAPKPPVNLTAELIYSQKGVAAPLLTDPLIVPDIFWLYLKYGILANCFSKDGEMRDARRAAVCEKRYERGVQYGKKFMRSIQVEMDFSRLATAGVQ